MFGPLARAEPVAKEGVSFSLPFVPDENGDSALSTSLALADKLKPGLNVVLIGKKICKARTGSAFAHELGFQATYLLGYGKCDPDVAVMGVEAEAIRVISPQVVRSPIPMQIELKARRLLLAREAAKEKKPMSEFMGTFGGSHGERSYGPLSDNSPKAFKVKEGLLLDFNWKDEDNGPSVWVVDDRVFLLPGVCRVEYRFFSIEDRLHLAYRSGGCCACGDNTLYVYDLSGSNPKKLYENGKLAD